MKAIFIGIVGLSMIAATCCQVCPISPEERECLGMRFTSSNSEVDFATFSLACATANFTAIDAGDLTSLCDIPLCITLLSEIGYEPCGRPDLANCVRESCGLPLTTEEGMQTCLVSQEEFECFGTRFSRTENTETNFTAFDLACETANFPAVTAGDLFTLCDIPDCITLLGEIGYEPCGRPDLSNCIRESCGLPTVATPMPTATEGTVKMSVVTFYVLFAAILSTLAYN